MSARGPGTEREGRQADASRRSPPSPGSARIALLGLALCAPSTALGYSDTAAFARDPSADTTGGGGGIYFTGSPRQHGLDCAACHEGGPPGTALTLAALAGGDRARLFEDGYEPGQTYELEVAFYGEGLTPSGGCEGHEDEPCDVNLFALEILDGEGVATGAFCPSVPAAGPAHRCDRCGERRARGTIAEDDCAVIVADGFDGGASVWRNGITAYSFFWTAPAEDLGPLTLYVSAVDGAGRAAEGDEATSFEGDGVITLSVPLSSPSRRYEPPSSCTSTGLSEGAATLLLPGLLALALFTRRRLR